MKHRLKMLHLALAMLYLVARGQNRNGSDFIGMFSKKGDCLTNI